MSDQINDGHADTVKGRAGKGYSLICPISVPAGGAALSECQYYR